MVKKNMDTVDQTTRVITVHVPEATFRKLKLISASTDMSNADIIIRAIDTLDVQAMAAVKPSRVKVTRTMDDTVDTDWTEELKPGPGEPSIVRPWQPLSKDKQVDPDLLIDDNYSCRSATITFAGPRRPDGPVRVFGSKSPGLVPVLPEPAWCATSRSGC